MAAPRGRATGLEFTLTLPAWCTAERPGSKCHSLHHSPDVSAPGRGWGDVREVVRLRGIWKQPNSSQKGRKQSQL